MPLKPWVTPDGYLRVSLSRGGKKSNHLVHVLVATAFVKRPAGDVEVNHIDCQKDNARAGNLEWLTRVENMAHAKLHGLRPTQVGDTASNIKLGSGDFKDVLQKLVDGQSVGKVADEFNVNRTTILNARRRAGVSTKRGQYTMKEDHDSETLT